MKNNKVFTGFSSEIIRFLEDLINNNNKEWFDSKRSFYEKEIRDKSKEFVVYMSEIFTKENLNYISDKKFSLFRINRDIRFSANKNPYKTNIGIYFPFTLDLLNINKENSLGLYFHLEPNSSFYACGIHNPSSSELNLIRKNIAIDYEDFYKLINTDKFKNNFPEIFSMTPPVTRVSGYKSDHPAFKDLCRKDYIYGKKIPDSIFFDNNFPDLIVNLAKNAEDFLKFIYHSINNY